jgi:hypothetical protein
LRAGAASLHVRFYMRERHNGGQVAHLFNSTFHITCHSNMTHALQVDRARWSFAPAFQGSHHVSRRCLLPLHSDWHACTFTKQLNQTWHRMRDGRYVAPIKPGYSAEMIPESIARYSFPDGQEWRGQ